jgi:hypothetical protein
MKKLKILLLLFCLASSYLQSQVHIYAGPGFGKLRYFQGPAQTRAFKFNNLTDVEQEMDPNQNFNGYVIGTSLYAGIFNFGLEWNTKHNSYSGTRTNGISVERKQQMNSFYVNFGMGNKVEDDKPKKIIYRIQAAWGGMSYFLKEKIQGTTDDSDGILDKAKSQGTVRGSVSVLIPIYKKISINVVPYYEIMDSDGYVHLTTIDHYYNITNYGVNLNLDYEF